MVNPPIHVNTCLLIIEFVHLYTKPNCLLKTTIQFRIQKHIGIGIFSVFLHNPWFCNSTDFFLSDGDKQWIDIKLKEGEEDCFRLNCPFGISVGFWIKFYSGDYILAAGGYARTFNLLSSYFLLPNVQTVGSDGGGEGQTTWVMIYFRIL